MAEETTIHSFEGHGIRSVWDANLQMWLFSAVDVIGALGISSQPRRYWSDFKHGNALETSTVRRIVQLKLPSPDGRMRATDAIPADCLSNVLAALRCDESPRFILWAIGLEAPKAESRARCAIGLHTSRVLMPLTNAAFPPGGALASAQAIDDPDSRAVAMAEYHYYRGEAQAASDLSEPYLKSSDPALRLAACWLHGYANLTLNRADRTYRAFDSAREVLADLSVFSEDPQLAAEGVLAITGAATLLHLPVPDSVPPLDSVMGALPEGLRLLAAYVNAHRLYLAGDWSVSAGIAEGALAFSSASHPIPQLYLHMACVMNRISLRQPDRAREHLMAAWDLARPDGLIEPFAEHHGLLGGMLEQCLRTDYPDDFRRIIDITYRFSYGWRRIHNPHSGHEVADTLSTTQFTCAMLASRGWTNGEIADHLGVSASTVKSYLSEAYEKLGIARREQLAPFMLK